MTCLDGDLEYSENVSEYSNYDEQYPEDSSYFSSIAEMYFLSLGCMSSLPKIIITIQYSSLPVPPPQISLTMETDSHFQVSVTRYYSSTTIPIAT